MTTSEILTLATAIVAVYGAGLSTYTFLAKRRDRRRQVKVDLSPGILGTYPEVTNVLMLSASNPGNRAVTLEGVSLDLPDKHTIVLINPGGDVRLPHQLGEGKRCLLWGDCRGIAFELRKQGYSGAVRLVGVFRDAVGTRYRSKPLNFSVEKWS